MAAGIVFWFWLRRLNLRAGGADLIEALSARPPRRNDQDERWLAGTVETAAIAAGVPAPSLFLIDQPVVNAAAIGTSPRNSAILVTRGLLDTLSQAEIEATLGRLVTMICAGDLAVAHSVNAAFQTFELCLALLDLPVRWSAWRTMGGLALVAVTPRPSPEQITRTALRLDDSMQAETIVDIDKLIAKFPIRQIGIIVTAPLLPFLLISALFKMVVFLWTALFVNPPLWLMWRSRCLWTDATAARRNLNPDELASALGKMTAVPDGAEWHAYLFLGYRENKQAKRRTVTIALMPSISARRRRLLAMGADPSKANERWYGAGFIAIVAILLVPLVLLCIPLLAAIGFLTLLVMTFALGAGLELVAALL
jgi:hypothetical protein